MSWQDKIRNPNCELCPLHESADYVCLMGQGPKKAKWMIVGEAPGEREDETHAAFVGRSGQLLRKTLREVGLDPSEAYITNVAKCRPPDNRAPSRSEAKICGNTYLAEEVRRVDPDYILAVGNAPLTALTGLSGITKQRGSLIGITFPTFHPAYVLRSPQHEPTFRADLERFARYVGSKPTKAATSKIKLVRTKQGLRTLRTLLAEAEVIAFDFETNDRGPKIHKDFRYYQPWEPGAAIVCVSFSVKEGESYVVPLWHDESPWKNNWQTVWKYFKPALERDVKLVAHNGKFDCKWALQFGVNTRLTFDTMLAAHILEENRLKGLKPLSQLFLGADAYAVELVDTHTIPIRKLARYAGKDTDYTLRLYNIFKGQLREHPRLKKIFTQIMIPASNALTVTELGGMYCVPEHIDEQMGIVSALKEDALGRFKKHLPKHKRETFNLNSFPQMAEFLFGDLKLKPIKLTKSGKAPSTDESVLLQLASKHKAPKILLEYRKHKGNLEKLTAWQERRDERSRVHTNFKLFGTVTGRLSSEQPNLQQVPREGPMRSCFGAPEGWTFVEADYSQVELRIAAMLSRDSTLLRIFGTGGDPHLTTACEITGLTADEIRASDSSGATEHRKKAKGVNFGFLYGMGEDKFMDYARDSYGVEVTPQEAHDYRVKYFKLYRELKPWHDRQIRLAQKWGQVHSPIGRIRHLPTINSSEKGMRKDAERQAINSPVQSFASDLMLVALCRLFIEMPMNEARIVTTVHDMIGFEIRDQYVEKWVPRIREVMEDIDYIEKLFDVEITVPIEVEIKAGQYWGQGKVVLA